MQALIGFWSHALAAIAFAAVLLWRVTQPAKRPGQALMLAALALTACWAWLSGIEPASAPAGTAGGECFDLCADRVAERRHAEGPGTAPETDGVPGKDH